MQDTSTKSKAQLIEELDALRARVRELEAKTMVAHNQDVFRKMVDGLPQTIFYADPRGDIVYINTAARDIFGFTADDVKAGLNISQVLTQEEIGRASEALQAAMAGRPSKGQEFTALRKDGTPFPAKIYAKGVQMDGQTIGACGIVIDQTDIKEAEHSLAESEKYYRAMFENTGAATCILDEGGVITSCNRQFEKLCGFSTQEMVYRMTWMQFVAEEDLERMQRISQARLSRQPAPNNYDFTFIPKDGIPRHINVFVSVIPGTATTICSLIDISQRVKTEAALRASEERYALVLRGTNDGIWDWDLATDAVYFSPRYKAMLGYEDHEFPNVVDSWMQHVHPEDKDRVLSENMPCVQGETDQFEVEYRLRHKNGSYRWVLGRGASVKDENGKPYRIGGTHTDVTERKNAEERYKTLVENATHAVFMATPDGRYISANLAWAQMLGFDSPAEMLTAIDNIADQVYANPEDREHFLRELADKGKLDNYEFSAKRKDGSRLWIAENIRVAHDSRGNPIYFEGFAQDITARKLSELTSRALYAITEAVTSTRDLRHLYERIHAILDDAIDAPNFFISMLDRENDRVIFPFIVDEMDDYYDIRNISAPGKRGLTAHILKTGENLFLTNKDPDHIRRQLELGVSGTPPAVWLGVPLKLDDEIIGTMTVKHYTDPGHYTEADLALLKAVSEQVAFAIERKANQDALSALNEQLETKVEARTAELAEKAMELEAANNRLRKLDEIKSALVSSVSHELRTPLTSIRGFAKLAGKDFDRFFIPLAHSPELEKKAHRIFNNLQIIGSEGERLTRLINDFLDINRIESGNARWNDALVNPCAIINKAVQAVTGAFVAQGTVELTVNLPARVPHIHADPDKIQQVMLNLLNNAYKFTRQGTVSISVAPTIDMLTITVADTGIGIPKEELTHIFDKFHKSKSGDTVDVTDKGTGLGLAICREIIEHYGGTIWVESTPGQGSAFSFTLPGIMDAPTDC